ncbi:MAG TPA: DUF4392 domain-containing protein [Synergistales bacterium]|nr:DUF4392 domain-containing protein [Synergistales bacterium]
MTVPLQELSSIVASDLPGRRVPVLLDLSSWERALECIMEAGNILLITGFMVPGAGTPETDGPPGSVVLGRALARLGKEVRIVTDPNCFEGINGCSMSVEGPEVLSLEKGEDLFDYSPDLLIFVERLGKAADGRYYNMRCEDISALTYPLDEAAWKASEKGIPVIAIGDGGNEAGMGLIADRIIEVLPDFRKCISMVPSDVVLPVDVSNWGAYALTAMLSLEKGIWMGHSPREEEIMLEKMFSLGCVDGVTGKTALSVDGFPLSENLKIIEDLHRWWERKGPVSL